MKKWAAAWIVVFVTGLMFFNNVDLEKEVYWMPYFLWDKGKDVITVACFVACFRKDRGLLLKILPVLILSTLRFIWEPLSNLIGWNINDHRANNIFFCLLVFVYAVIFLNESKWPNSK